MVYDGGCPCGATRYRICGEPLSAGYCHCPMCQRAAGTPVVAWVAFRRADFRYVKGEPGALPAGARATRWLCPHCGGALTFEYSAYSESVDVNFSTLDDPNSTETVYQFWSSDRLRWRHGGGEMVH